MRDNANIQDRLNAVSIYFVAYVSDWRVTLNAGCVMPVYSCLSLSAVCDAVCLLQSVVLAAQRIVKRVICNQNVCSSVRPSVCLSLTHVIHA